MENPYAFPDPGVYGDYAAPASYAYPPPPTAPPYTYSPVPSYTYPAVAPPGVTDVVYAPAPVPVRVAPKPKKISYAPLIVYLILVVIWLLGTIFAPNTGNSKVLTIVSALFWAILWGVLIWILCRRGHTFWAWFMALFSLISWGIFLVFIFIGLIVFTI